MSRYQAFAIHLGLSLIIFAVLAALVIYVWYPQFFFETDGGWQGIRIIVLVDLVLGPLLTLVVYKAGKPGLKTDLTMIGTVQALCLLAGTWVVYNERPLALVFADGQFNSVTADTYRNAGRAVPDFSRFPGPSPKWVMVELPEDPVLQSDIRRQLLRDSASTVLLVEHYQPFDTSSPVFTDESTAFDIVAQDDFKNRGIARFAAAHELPPSSFRFYPYASRYEYFYLAFEPGERRPVGPLKPGVPTKEEQEALQRARRSNTGVAGAS